MPDSATHCYIMGVNGWYIMGVNAWYIMGVNAWYIMGVNPWYIIACKLTMIDSIPHSWLFQRMAAVVHHGGAGTTAAGLRAGVPGIIVPFFADQPFWGARVAELGVGPKPIPRKSLTAEQLSRAIQVAVTNADMRQRAANLGAKIQSEDGVAEAVEIIGRLKM
ncbi:MAG: Desosaminyl transferase EryCIII precursor [Chloroflexi bacterium ADurb.Bin360]|nr:MAG: Desosaminyl transferase EryCIII precursor [Chloroflexi bacterium ADurb.Bin360]